MEFIPYCSYKNFFLEDILARAKEIQLIEEELIAEGKLPKEGYIENEEHSVEIDEDNYEIELVREFFSLFIINFI